MPSNSPDDSASSTLKPNTTTSTVVVADPKPLSLLATAGILHHEGMRCICARSTDAVLKAFELELADETSVLPKLQARIDDGHPKPTELEPSSNQTPTKFAIDLLIWDVADDPMSVLTIIQQIRQIAPFQNLPVVLLADSKWAGLEKKTEAEAAPTHCLFNPIDPKSLITIAQHLLWMPSLQATHRQRGSRPNRPGWVTL
ncbi:hypothetical protein [Rhodopirellula bahusiensis]|uniref:Response regulatory domain-containing protein n=1 Tax=Rhodopirellula bahusiensis TaxID=2014065 RepID=A0A2G1WAK5_9BACT|nr:hypothetical protein [Rhodopirellula bahusiensis]PHQ36075.1 hypothetical protein CEE69_06805 [Rhodopirellula bahusiensis]